MAMSALQYGICERCGEREGRSAFAGGPWKIICGACYIPANWVAHRAKVRGSARRIDPSSKRRRRAIYREFAARHDARKLGT